MTPDVPVFVPPGQRIALIADVQNLFHGAKARWTAKVQYDKLLDGLKMGRDLVRATAFIVHRPDQKQDGFLEALARFGYDLRLFETKMRSSEFDTGKLVASRTSVEVPITLEAMSMVGRIDTIILATGDGAYAPLVAALQGRGCRVEIAGVEGSISKDLRRAERVTEIPEAWTLPDKVLQEKLQARNASVAPVSPVYVPPSKDIDYDKEQPASNTTRQVLARR